MASQDELFYEMKIPRDRIGVVIGISGSMKKEIEERAHVKLRIDSKEGDISISSYDPIGLYTAKEIIKAIGRGFNPEIAKLLFNEDYILEIVDITMFTGRKSKNAILRVKGRVIGERGKSRQVLENLTGAYISVFGKTVSVIGEADATDATRRAVESLLRGAKHANVYKALESWKKKRRLGL